ncbi:MAG TPA: asparagine synthase (glutamine-hydrolyzing) [Thermoanaerobaculia bacterium]|nr:asparagine synthase (glutamine-hydrolyzing) [Thermoanaerobaculia bacterium]
MCGIYGAVAPGHRSGQAPGPPTALEGMGQALHHRGPDGHSLLLDAESGFGTERLRIVDLDPRADQPFVSPNGRLRLACNGEIYNAPELRRRYRDYPFVSRSDVETILPLYLDRGLPGLADLDGMFGLALWDGVAEQLILARDRAGEKPLFYVRLGREVWFASEVQALLGVPRLSRELDEVALAQFLALGYVLEPRTLFSAIRRVEAGTFLCFGVDGREQAVRYWDPAKIAAGSPDAGPVADAVPRLRSLLETAVGKQVQADVPIGVFTSGGLDSSILAALTARTLGADRVHTYSARFTAASYDESAWSARVAARLGTRHVEVDCGEPALHEAWTAVTDQLAEPLADPAILPVYLLARAARREVKVILSGEGADELFGGYPTYLGHRLAPWLLRLPVPLRRLLSTGLHRLPASGRKVTIEYLLKRFLAEIDRPWAERHLCWFGTGLVRDREGWERAGLDALLAAAGPDPAGALLLDYRTYLRDGLLVKVDRATMLQSVEARAPYLDRDVTAFALALPIEEKIRGLTGKRVLKRAARAWLPRAVVERRKRGLSVPVAGWINNGLGPEVDRLLAPERLRRQEILDAGRIGQLLAEHRAGRANHARPLWAALVLERWLERWLPERA